MTTETSPGRTLNPARAVPKKYLEPILYLADRMSASDGNVLASERRVIDELASAVNMKNFRHERSFRALDDETACKKLDLEAAKTAALVVISLVLKADMNRDANEHEYFRKIRTMMGAQPVTVPTDVNAHRELALEFLKG